MKNWTVWLAAAVILLVGIGIFNHFWAQKESNIQDGNSPEASIEQAVTQPEAALVEERDYMSEFEVTGTIYYVSESGDNANPGTKEQPFRTINHAARLMIPGDATVVGAGIYPEIIKPKQSGTKEQPIRFVAHPGEQVVITGADVLSDGWTLHEGHIYKLPVDQEVKQLFHQTQMLTKARWPNLTDSSLSNMVRAEAAKGTDYELIAHPDLPSGDWTGASVHFWPGREWTVYTKKIGKYEAGKELWFQEPFPRKDDDGLHDFDPVRPIAGNHFYLSGSLAGLDSPGEWHWDKQERVLYVWMPDGEAPKLGELSVRRRGVGVDLNSRSFIEIYGFDLVGASITMERTFNSIIDGVKMTYTDHFTEISGMDDTSYLSNVMTGGGNVLRNSTIAHTAGHGFAVGGEQNTITNNVVYDVNYAGGYFGNIRVLKQANQITISHNTMYDSGRFLIFHSDATKVDILHNRLYNAGLLTNDNGATYTWGTDGAGSIIAYNWVHDNKGKEGVGIYLDNHSSNYIVHHNIVANNQMGIVLNSASLNNTIVNNTVVFNDIAFNVYTYPNETPSQQGTRIINNLYNGTINVIQGELAPEMSNNLTYNRKTLAEHYVPADGADIIDKGIVVEEITASYQGEHPDVGAREFGQTPWPVGANHSGR